MERSTARVFASRQWVLLRALSGRGTKVECELSVIPGYWSTDFCSGAVSRYNAEAELRVITGYWNFLLALERVWVDHRNGYYPGVLKPCKNRDEFINYTDVLAILPLVELVVITGCRTVCFFVMVHRKFSFKHKAYKWLPARFYKW